MDASDFPVIAVTHGLSGYFAVMYHWNPEHGGFPEPYQTGAGRYPKTLEGELAACTEACQWSRSDRVRLDPAVRRRRRELYWQLSLQHSSLDSRDYGGTFDTVAGQRDPNENIP